MIERWELLQAQDLSKEIRTKQNQQQRQQLNSDLNKILAWLGQIEEELEQQQRLELCTDIQAIEQHIKKLKVGICGSSGLNIFFKFLTSYFYLYKQQHFVVILDA